ncbi:MAG: response regulator [Anaerolineaceae bacterium]|nr:response regulator [Anaerolineaceae bacterium]
MTHVLLIDDDTRLTTPLRSSFERAGFTVSIASDGYTGLSKSLVENPDVIILDVMMPGLDGWAVCKAIRERSPVPIIMLTALDDAVDRIRGLELGADDYLVKPFGFQELHAHVKAMLRRVQLTTQPVAPRFLRSQEIEVNVQTHEVKRAGKVVMLRQKEYDILLLLMSNPDRVIKRDELFDRVWGTDWLGDTRTLDVHMSWLRTKLEDDPAHPVYLQTVRGVGYRFAVPVETIYA